ncbi:MAG: glycosyl transferase [Thermodesulfobacteriota bacterium]
MADFFQHGAITTLQNLRDRPIDELDAELKAICGRKRKTVLLLPALYSEFETPSMPKIIEELTKVGYLYRVVLSLDRADRRQFESARRLMSVLPTDVKIVWQGGGRIQKLYKELEKNDFKLDLPGKGRSVWMAIGYILSDAEVYAMALHDCDILNYSRGLLARLVYPIVHPACDFEFSKGYYARVTDKLYGRVTRLFYAPLIRTMTRILGYNAFIDYLDSFRYALSGEFAFVSNLARSIRISPTWGLEVSMLSEVYQLASANRICQVEIAQSYEHKHQVLRKDKPDQGLVRMATDIAKALFRVLSHDGIVMSEAFFRTLLIAYIQESRIVIEKYHALALLNGLTYDRHAEIEASEVFLSSLKSAMREFIADPVGIPMLAAWVRVNAALPDFSERLAEAVTLDNKP